MIIILVTSTIFLLIMKIVLKINLKDLKKLSENQKLDKYIKRFSSNKEICKKILKKLGNEKVEIEENEKNTTMYIAISNKIIIGDLKENYSRIQTIAHECLHSIQDKRLQKFHFIISNIYLLYFIIIIILELINKLQNRSIYLIILLILGSVYITIRNYLENDAMIKAKYLAKEYIEEEKILKKQEETELINAYEKINKIGIPISNFQIWSDLVIKIIIFCIIDIIQKGI